MTYLVALVIGSLAGVLSGLFGIGGGIIIVPALILFLGLSQQKAQGTSLACLLLPVGILGVLKYSKSSDIDWQAAIFLALGLIVGTYAGANVAVGLDPVVARKSFAVFLMIIATYLFVRG